VVRPSRLHQPHVQVPGGVPFEPLAEGTIERKGSSKALIDTGFLVNAITQRILADSAFVGLLRGTVYPKGEDARNPVPPSTIGAIMEYGATIPMPNGGTIIIPPRPFLHPIMEKQKKQVEANFKKVVAVA